MENYKGTVDLWESTDKETAYFWPSLHTEHTIYQSVAIAPLTKHEVSIIMSKHYDKFDPSFIHMIFTEEETDILINALLECKKRWKTGNVIGED
jgi:hypothetical protein